MFLFFGTRSGKTEITVIQNISYPHCEQNNTLSLATTPNYFHLFWIKLFKIGKNSFITCSHCKRGFYKEEFTEDMSKSIERL